MENNENNVKIENPPQHIAMILDGNRRWAKEKGIPQLEGHLEGLKNVEKIGGFLRRNGIKYFTIYGLSVENIKKRSAEEVAYHFNLHKNYIKKHILDSDEFMKNNVRFVVLGRRDMLPKDEQEMIIEAEEKTKNNDGMQVNVCLAYNGQDEIVDAVKEIVKKGINVDEIDRNTIKENMYSKEIPPPDMIIRTGMKDAKRLSGFLLWDCSYTEFFFTDTYWPALSEEEVTQMIEEFNGRERRLGK